MSPSARPSESPAGGPRRRRTKARSRAALLAAAQSLMARGEPVTTVRIAEQAGLAQPTFYAHFPSVDACRLAAVEDAIARLGDFAAERRRHLLEAGSDVEAKVEATVRWLEGAREHGDIQSIHDRYAGEGSPVGAALRAMAQTHLASVTEDLHVLATRRGVGSVDRGELRRLALMLTAAFAGVARAVHRGHITDLRAAALTVVRIQDAAFEATLAAHHAGTNYPA